MADYSTNIIREEKEIAILRKSWIDCRAKYSNYHFQLHPDWFEMERRLIRKRGGFPVVVTLHRGPELVGIAPLRIVPHRFSLKVGYYTLARFPVLLADLCGETLLAPPDQLAQETILRAISKVVTPFHMLFFESLEIDSDLWKLLKSSAEIRKNYWLFYHGPTIHHCIRFQGTLEGYLRKFSSDSRKKMRRWSRKLREACGDRIKLDRISDRFQVEPFLKDVELISSKGWKGVALGRILRVQDFLESIAYYANLGWLRSYLLRCDGKPVAFRTAIQVDGVVYLLETAYDPEWSAFQPGKVLLQLMIEDMFAFQKPEYLDFGYGDNQHKKFFATDSYREANTYLVRKSAYGAAIILSEVCCASFRKNVLRAIDLLKLKERLRHYLRRD